MAVLKRAITLALEIGSNDIFVRGALVVQNVMRSEDVEIVNAFNYLGVTFHYTGNLNTNNFVL